MPVILELSVDGKKEFEVKGNCHDVPINSKSTIGWFSVPANIPNVKPESLKLGIMHDNILDYAGSKFPTDSYEIKTIINLK